MTKGDNIVSITWQTEVMNWIKAKAAQEDMTPYNWSARRQLTTDLELKQYLIDKFGQERYNELVKCRDKTMFQTSKEKEDHKQQVELKEQQDREFEMKLAELQEKQRQDREAERQERLAIKAVNSESYAKVANAVTQKTEIREAEFEKEQAKIAAAEAQRKAIEDRRWKEREDRYIRTGVREESFVSELEADLVKDGYPKERLPELRRKRAEHIEFMKNLPDPPWLVKAKEDLNKRMEAKKAKPAQVPPSTETVKPTTESETTPSEDIFEIEEGEPEPEKPLFS
jgi:DNA polymerase III alpha subunit (gram-positive type)